MCVMLLGKSGKVFSLLENNVCYTSLKCKHQLNLQLAFFLQGC